MSNRYKGGVISATPPTTTGGEDGTASGAWTLEQQMQLQAAGLWPAQPTGPYIEQVFSTYLYTGNGSTQTITNGINLSGKGGMVWAKMRSNGSVTGNVLFDTVRGASQKLESNSTGASSNWTPYGVSAFGSTGFTVADDGAGNYITNNSGVNYASWTFRKQAKFFDIVTYTGDGTTSRSINHNLTSTPGCIIVKRTDSTGSWYVYHRGVDPTSAYAWYLLLNSTAARAGAPAVWDVPPTSTAFTVQNGTTNDSGATYVAYLFAHNAGGFGLTGTDNVISCGSFTTDGSGNATVTLGYEPQWVVIKNTTSPENWFLNDIMRGMPAPPSGSGTNVNLFPNTSAAESIQGYDTSPTATGFAARTGNPSQTYIYIAIRRGPMRVPTSGTSVFSPLLTSTTSGATNTTGFPVDSQFLAARGGSVYNSIVSDRLRGVSSNSTETGRFLVTSATSAENTSELVTEGWNNTAFLTPSVFAGVSYITWNFGRAPSFFDEVCYTGTGVTHTETHNLGVAPELIIVKRRASATASWAVYAAPLTASYVGFLDLTNAFQADNMWNSTAPTSTAFTVRAANAQVNASGSTYVAYLFATCAGVSKVGSYTGTATTKQVDCGFTGGARFVLIKRTDSTGDWYVWDSARGIVSGNDPYLLLNSTAAEVTNTDYVDTYSAGFEISSTAPAAINASGGTFIFLAIA